TIATGASIGPAVWTSASSRVSTNVRSGCSAGASSAPGDSAAAPESSLNCRMIRVINNPAITTIPIGINQDWILWLDVCDILLLTSTYYYERYSTMSHS